jgi:hypothetical protein
MKTLVQLEEVGLLTIGIYLFGLLDYQWWWFPALILVPDFSMIGYVAGPRTGAYVYNFFHHRLLAVLVYLAGIYLSNELLQLTGIILFSHASMDRVFGYGFKYESGFKTTHLGEIGK